MAYSQTPNRNSPRPQPEGFEQVLQIRRVSKKTQGGSQVAFSALVVTKKVRSVLVSPKPLTSPMPSRSPSALVIVTWSWFLSKKALFPTKPNPNLAPQKFFLDPLPRVLVSLPVLPFAQSSKPLVLPTSSVNPSDRTTRPPMPALPSKPLSTSSFSTKNTSCSKLNKDYVTCKFTQIYP